MSESTDPQTIANEAAGSSKVITNLEEYEKKTAEIDQFMTEAKILYSSESYGEAADKYEIAVKTATEFFGQFSHECFQPALNYGKALIEVARLNVQLVDKPLDGIYEEDEELEDVGQDDQTVTKEDEQKNEDKIQEENKANQEGGNSVDNETKPSQLDQILATKMEEFKPEEEQEEEDPDDIQTAWEWLEVARKICEKQQETTYWLEWKSNVLMALGECMTVADEFEQALAEFINALEIRQKIFPPHDRLIAETHFFIALSQKNLGKFDKAAEQYEKAKQILEGAIDAKKKEMDSDIKNSEKLSEQIAEMEGLIKSVEENIQDAYESAESCPQNTALSGLLPETKKLPNPADVLTEGVEVNDMSGLVKRKPLKRPLVEKSVENVELKSENGTVIEKKEQNRNELVQGPPLQPDPKRVKIYMDGDGNEKTE